MAQVQEGFLYEENVAKALIKKNWVRKNFEPAGASSTRPDLDLLINGVEDDDSTAWDGLR